MSDTDTNQNDAQLGADLDALLASVSQKGKRFDQETGLLMEQLEEKLAKTEGELADMDRDLPHELAAPEQELEKIALEALIAEEKSRTI